MLDSRTVLLVDDDVSFARAVERVLSSSGFEVTTATNGRASKPPIASNAAASSAKLRGAADLEMGSSRVSSRDASSLSRRVP